MSDYGIKWLEDFYPDLKLSDLGKEVADFLDSWYSGMHNFVHQTQMDKINWENNHHIVVPFGRGMATFDGSLLTKLVLMSHDRMLRVEINPRHYRYIELVFHKRTTREGSLFERMPTMEKHIQALRGIEDSNARTP